MKKEQVIRNILFIIGLSILGFGARLLLLSDVGTSGIDALAIGIANLLNLSFGMVINFIGITLIIIGTVLKRRGLEWKPIVTSILYGIIFDGWGGLLFNRLYTPTESFYKGIIFLAGLIITALGGAIYILMDISTSSLDYLMLAIRDRYNFSIQNSRIILETLLVIGAWLVKGPIGIGTICIMLLFGPALQIFMKVLRPLFVKVSILKQVNKANGIKVQKYGLKNK